MANFGELVVRLALDATGFSSSLAGAKNDLIKWRDETNQNTMEMAKWGAAIGATVAPVIAVGAAAYGTIEKFGGMAQSIKDLSYVTGLSTQKIQELQYAATLSGTNFAVVTSGLDNFTVAISKAGDATSDAGKAFATLGVTTTGRTTDQILDDTVSALVNMKSETDRNAIAMTLYGKSWKEMIPYMDKYIENAKEIRANPYLTDAELDANEKAKEQLDALGKKWETVEGKMVAYFTGYFANAQKAYEQAALNDANSPYAKSILAAMAGGSANNSGADWTNKAVTQAADVATLIDKYAGLNDTQIDLIETTDLLTEAEKSRDAAANQADFDKYSAAVQKYKNHIDELNASLAKSATAAKAATTAWADTAVVGSAGSEMYLFMMQEMEAGTDYQTALNNWGSGTHTVTNREGTLGAAKASGASTAGTAVSATTKTSSPTSQATADTGTLTKELDKQATLFSTLGDRIKDSWIITEKNAKTHWTAMSEFARISMQKLMDDWGTTVGFVDSNVAYEQTISMFNGVPAADPIAVPDIIVPTLATIDFSKVSMLGGGGTGKNENSSGEKSGGNAAVTVNVKVENETTVNSRITASVSDSMAQVIAVNGGTAGL